MWIDPRPRGYPTWNIHPHSRPGRRSPGSCRRLCRWTTAAVAATGSTSGWRRARTSHESRRRGGAHRRPCPAPSGDFAAVDAVEAGSGQALAVDSLAAFAVRVVAHIDKADAGQVALELFRLYLGAARQSALLSPGRPVGEQFFVSSHRRRWRTHLQHHIQIPVQPLGIPLIHYLLSRESLASGFFVHRQEIHAESAPRPGCALPRLCGKIALPSEKTQVSRS